MNALIVEANPLQQYRVIHGTHGLLQSEHTADELVVVSVTSLPAEVRHLIANVGAFLRERS